MDKRQNLKMFRLSHDLTQEQMAEKIGVDRQRYHHIESGNRLGRFDFWQKLQVAFDLSGEDIWQMQQTQKKA